jgi:hypothetical protein
MMARNAFDVTSGVTPGQRRQTDLSNDDLAFLRVSLKRMEEALKLGP